MHRVPFKPLKNHPSYLYSVRICFWNILKSTTWSYQVRWNRGNQILQQSLPLSYSLSPKCYSSVFQANRRGDKKCHLLSVELTCAYRNDLHHMKESAHLHAIASKNTQLNLPFSSLKPEQIYLQNLLSIQWSESKVICDIWNHPSNNDKTRYDWTI